MDRSRPASCSTTSDNSRPRVSQAGFTLLEVLVALAVSALILTAVFSVLLGSIRVQNLAVSQGGFAVNAQRLLNQMVDGSEGVIAAEQVIIAENGSLSYRVGSVTVSYQLADGKIIRSSDGTVSEVLSGVQNFMVAQVGSTIEIALEAQSQGGSGTTIIRTSVVPRNL